MALLVRTRWPEPSRSTPVRSEASTALRRGLWGLVVALSAAAGATGVARADDIDARLDAYENEAHQLANDLPHPNQTTGPSQRRLLDGEVAYALGDYTGASLALFELASKPGPDRETASFYLAESLFQKGDRGAARSYYEQVAASNNVASRYY